MDNPDYTARIATLEALCPRCNCHFCRGLGGGRCEYCGGIIPFDPTWGGTVPGPDELRKYMEAQHADTH